IRARTRGESADTNSTIPAGLVLIAFTTPNRPIASPGVASGGRERASFPLVDVDTLDQEPQRYQQLTQRGKRRKQADLRREAGRKHRDNRRQQIAEASYHQEDADESGQEARLVDQVAVGEQPEAPEHLGDPDPVVVEVEKQGQQSLLLIRGEGSGRVG